MMPKFTARWFSFCLRLGLALSPLLAAALVLTALLVAGNWARDSLADRDRYQFPFNHIECAAPAGMSRTDFLDEVQYLAGLPDRVNVLDENLAARLAQAFALHPRVGKVEGVHIRSAEQIQVRLVFRTAMP
jgi:hypothetical protein